MRTALYRHYDSTGILLYVGISLSAINRLLQHQRSAKWVLDAVRMETKWFDVREEAEAAEIVAIKTEKPIFNIAHTIEKNTITKLKSAKPRRKVKLFKTVLCEFEDFTLNGQRVYLACMSLVKDRNSQLTMDGDFEITPKYYAEMFDVSLNTAVIELNLGARDLLSNKTTEEYRKKGWLSRIDHYDEPDGISIRFTDEWLRTCSN
jgi:hypothetical protein